MYQNLINVFTAILEIIIALVCFEAILTKRDIKYKTKYLIVFLFIVFNSVRSCIAINENINLIISILMIGAMASILHCDIWYKKIFTVFIYIVIFMVSEIISQYLVSFFMNISYGDAGNNKYTILIVSDFMALILSLYFLKLPAKKITDIPAKYWILIIFMPIFSLVILLMTDMFVKEHSNIYTLWSIIIVTGLIYCNLMLFNFFESYSNRIRLAVAKQLIENNQENYKILKANEEELRILNHDIRKHMSAIKSIVNSSGDEQALKYARQLEKTADRISSVVYTGNAAMDSILNIEGRIAAAHGIKYFVKTNITADINIEDSDITSILRNALDNAVEAEKYLPKKCIVIHIKVTEDIMEIIIQNFSDNVDVNNITTTKKNKSEHGYGLKSIKNTVYKYNGDCKIVYGNEIFSLKIILDNKSVY